MTDITCHTRGLLLPEDRELVDHLTSEIIKADLDAEHQEDLKQQIVGLVGDHGRDKILAQGLQAMKDGDRVVLTLADPVSLDAIDDVMERTAPRLSSEALVITSLYAAAAAQEAEAQRERQEAQERLDQRRREAEAIHRQVQEDNYNQALNIIQDAGKRLRWTQVSTRLNPISLRGVKVALKHHNNVIFTKKGKRVFVEWKD